MNPGKAGEQAVPDLKQGAPPAQQAVEKTIRQRMREKLPAVKAFFKKHLAKPPKSEKPRKIFVHITGYDNIFSDFDEGPLGERRISKDLVDEIDQTASGIPADVPLNVVFRRATDFRDKEDKEAEKILKRRIPLVFEDAWKKAHESARSSRNMTIGLFATSMTIIGLHSLFVGAYSELTGFLGRTTSTVLEIMTWLPAVFGVEFLLKYLQIKKDHVIPLERLSKISVTFSSAEKPKEQAEEKPEEKTGQEQQPKKTEEKPEPGASQ